MGHRTLASNLTPSLTPWMHLDSANSLTVMVFDGSSRPWSIQLWTRSRLTGAMSSACLQRNSNASISDYSTAQDPLRPTPDGSRTHRRSGRASPRGMSRYVHVLEASLALEDVQRRLAALEAMRHLSSLALSLVSSSGRLAFARGRASAASDRLLGRSRVRQLRQDRRTSQLWSRCYAWPEERCRPMNGSKGPNAVDELLERCHCAW